MAVAAVILARHPEAALEDAEGVPAIRRVIDAAGDGGAAPIVVVTLDPLAIVAPILAGSGVPLISNGPLAIGAVGWLRLGIEQVLAIDPGVTACLVWPIRRTWTAGATVRSIIEAHVTDPTTILRPAFEGAPGWPVLVPVGLADRLGPVGPDDRPDPVLVDVSTAGLPVTLIELPDAGAVRINSQG